MFSTQQVVTVVVPAVCWSCEYDMCVYMNI